ncbi:hypothetical protein HCH_07013 [Hahella chejuensis KCTC 2396]|uniref:Uncharacterized protein n=1 Tax=Hahella chejuensis (strain KCTC 2396) TaxID=349521 RepID=Q2S6U6_HAHCH|nr:hypothetical protein HCH_07013 [Hahella chejuensis KCTC 2396]
MLAPIALCSSLLCTLLTLLFDPMDVDCFYAEFI